MTSIALLNKITLLAALLFIGAVPSQALAGSALNTEVTIDPARAALPRTRPFTLVYGAKKWTAPATTVQTWYKTRSLGEQTLLQLRPGTIYDYLNVYISPQINELGVASRFKYIDGNLHLINPGHKGKIVDGEKTSLAIRSAIIAGKNSAPVYMQEHRPLVFSAADFKKLSFPDQLARGETNFAGSPVSRVHNISVATQRFDGLVIMPGEEFSFNEHLGTVDAAGGYLPELVIKENVTTPEYGGGICQVSTTAFRAALASGLQITERKNHSYPVRYYGAPGFDATVYPSHPDLKFTNDTGYPVYIATKIIGTRLIFDIRGTLGGRQTTINGPYVTARYPDGSLTTAIAQFVKLNGKTIREQNFVSNYQSPDKFPIIRELNKG